MNEWILLIFMYSPGGDFMDKLPVPYPDRITCESARKDLPLKGEDPWGVRYKAVCITRDHYTGKKPMKNVPLD